MDYNQRMGKIHKARTPSKLKGSVAAGLSAFFLIFALQAVSGFVSGASGLAFSLSALLITGGFSAHFGRLSWLHFYVWPQQQRLRSENEKLHQIVQYARQYDGRVSALEVAMGTQLEIEESRILLEKLVDRGLAEMQVSESAAMVFVFPDFAELPAPRGQSTQRGELEL